MAGILNAEANIPEGISVNLPDYCPKNFEDLKLWVSLKNGLPFIQDCIFGYAQTLWDNNKKKAMNIPGVYVYSPNFGSTYAMDSLTSGSFYNLTDAFSRVFHFLIEKFKALDYIDGEDMVGAGYDWRYFRTNEYNSTDNWYENTKQLIMRTYNKHGKLVIITHSMGGLMAYRLFDYLGKQFCAKYIDSFIPIGAPWLGAAKAVAVAIPVSHYGFPVSKDIIKLMSRRIETVPFIFPMGDIGKWGTDPILQVEGTSLSYGANDIQRLIWSVNDSVFNHMASYSYEHGFEETMRRHNYKIPYGIKTKCLFSSGLDTIKTIVTLSTKYEEGDKIIYGDGDQTVNIQSLEFCKYMGVDEWSNVGKYEHTEIIKQDITYEEIKNWVCDN